MKEKILKTETLENSIEIYAIQNHQGQWYKSGYASVVWVSDINTIFI
jgi:hypothetical protein